MSNYFSQIYYKNINRPVSLKKSEEVKRVEEEKSDEVEKPAQTENPTEKEVPVQDSNALGLPKERETKIDEMLRVIENIDTLIENHKNFKEINEKITGVPIRFILVPLKPFLKYNPQNITTFFEEGRYAKLPDTILDEYSKMLKNILDFKAENCIRDLVYESYRDSGNIIFNKNSDISKEIKLYEDHLNEITDKFYPIAVNGLKYYRNGKKKFLKSLIKESKLSKIYYKQKNQKEKNLEKFLKIIIFGFNAKLKMVSVQESIDKFIEKCKYELDGIKFRDCERGKNNYRLFTDEDSLIQWFKSDRCTKILLKTDGKESKNCNY